MRSRRGRVKAESQNEEAPPVGPEESAASLALDPEAERADELREAVARGGPRGRGSGGKGRSRREREQLTNWPVAAGHERKIAFKIRAGVAKRRRKQQRAGRARTKRPAKAKTEDVTAENLAL